MPRDSQGVFSKPPGTTAEPLTTIQSSQFNALGDDIVQELNTARPISVGGTAAGNVTQARINLGVVKQTGVSDTTAGSLMMVGAFGIGGRAPDITVTANALNSTSMVNGRVRVAFADLATVGGPLDATVGGVVDTIKYSDVFIAQVFYPANGTDPTPWRRVYNGTWSTWRRDYATGTNANGRWERFGNGLQICRINAHPCPYLTLSNCHGTWTFPAAFVSTAGLAVTANPMPADIADNSSLTTNADSLGPPLIGLGTTTSVGIRVYRIAGTTNFASDQTVHVSAIAIGRWF
jgi:hypothetical protein